MNVSTSGRLRSSHTFTTSFETSSHAGSAPACFGQGSFWHTFASPLIAPVADGAANAFSRLPTGGPSSPSPLFGIVCTNSRTARPMNSTMPTSQAYLFPACGISGRRIGSGWVRSRSASRSPGERSSKRSLSSVTWCRPEACEAAPRRAGRALGTGRAARPT